MPAMRLLRFKDLARLRDLLISADVVIEGSRPRALEALGLEYARINQLSTEQGRPDKLWLSLTAYGRGCRLVSG
ncbi:MAG: hypothetical protein CM15mP120_00940 [Pseudomonadota bacterium]|nr:MAG: hypothetical protein CM15mP120_00940 [Pseudomonadota bacterium]